MPLSDFLLNLAGQAEQIELRTTVQARIVLETALATEFGSEIIQAVASGGKTGLFTDTSNIAGHVLEVIQKEESALGKLIFENLVTRPMGVDANAVAPENRSGLDTIERVIGFAADLTLGTAAVSAALEPLLGSHGLGKMLEIVKGIPDEIGLNYFMGTVMANVFESATSGPLREAIMEQSRSARIEWPQISRLLKTHTIADDEATSRLQKAGFRDADIPLLKQLERQLLSLTDLQQLHSIGFFDTPTFTRKISELGFDAEDTNAVVRLTTHKDATSGENSVRSVALSQYRNGTLAESAFRAVLEQAEVPAETINALISGIKLEHSVRVQHESVSEIRDLWLNRHINSDEARARLQKLGLQDADISDLLLLWQDQKTKARSGIGTAKILSYLVSGELSKQAAYNHLIANGIDQADAQFLVDHPTTHSGVKTHPLTPETVVAAYKDGVLTVDEASAKLDALHVEPDEKELLLANASAVISRGHKPKHATKTLNEANVLDAMKFGLASPQWVERELETLGYAADDAILIVTIEQTRLDPGYPASVGWRVLA